MNLKVTAAGAWHLRNLTRLMFLQVDGRKASWCFKVSGERAASFAIVVGDHRC